MLGPLSPALIRISPSASDHCSRTCFVTPWCNRLYLTGTVDARPAVYGQRLLHHGMDSNIVTNLRQVVYTVSNLVPAKAGE